MILEYLGKRPVIGQDVFIAPTAVVIGDVVVGSGSSIWFGAVVRGDEGKIIIGEHTSVQDNAVLHTTPDDPTILGDRVTIGHGALLEGCIVEGGAVVGMGAVVLKGAVVGSQSLIAAGCVVTPRTIIPAKWLALGVPAKLKDELDEATLAESMLNSRIYERLRDDYRKQNPENCQCYQYVARRRE